MSFICSLEPPSFNIDNKTVDLLLITIAIFHFFENFVIFWIIFSKSGIF